MDKNADDDQISIAAPNPNISQNKVGSWQKNHPFKISHDIIDQSMSPIKYLTKGELLSDHYEFWTNLSLYDI